MNDLSVPVPEWLLLAWIAASVMALVTSGVAIWRGKGNVIVGLLPTTMLALAVGTGILAYVDRPDWRPWRPRTTPHPEDQALRVIDNEVRGAAVVSAPASAVQWKPFEVSLRVTPGNGLPLLLSQARAEQPDNNVVGQTGAWLTPKMEATVEGSGFTVTPGKPYVQAVLAKQPTAWVWQVTPTELGLLALQFKLTGSVKVGATRAEVPREFYAYTQSVSVHVDPKIFATRNWQTLATYLGTSVVSFVGGLWAMFKFRRSPKTPG